MLFKTFINTLSICLFIKDEKALELDLIGFCFNNESFNEKTLQNAFHRMVNTNAQFSTRKSFLLFKKEKHTYFPFQKYFYNIFFYVQMKPTNKIE